MKERPIIFSGLMVQAILKDRKTQTRRVVKHIPALGWPDDWCHKVGRAQFAEFVGDYRRYCPYGTVGSPLWVREAWAADWEHNRAFYRADADTDGIGVPHMVSGAGGFGGGVGHATINRWRPSIHMPRRFSRILLEVTDVRVERVQDISTDDAGAEGIDMDGGEDEHRNRSTLENFQLLWDSLNAKRGYPWDVNPWVWVITFKKLPDKTRSE